MVRSVAIVAASWGLLAASALSGCSPDPSPPEPAPRTVAPRTTAPASSPSASGASPTPSSTLTVAPTPTPTATATPGSRPLRFDAGRVLDDIDHLADDIGPREATSDSFAEAADWVELRFETLGYDVRRTKVSVPAGSSWGTPVRKGSSVNVIAEPPGFDGDTTHVVVGAHLDTVAVAPGAEDNASGVATMLELARLAARDSPDVGVQFIAFGAEEPRGTGDALHHFGSQQLVDDLPRSERRSISAMVALDRVGVRAGYVPVARADAGGTRLRSQLRAAGRRVDVTTRATQNTTSDHWSYAKADLPAVRVGSIPYAGYHSRGDTVKVVDRRQLDRVGRLMWSWLGGL